MSAETEILTVCIPFPVKLFIVNKYMDFLHYVNNNGRNNLNILLCRLTTTGHLR